MLKILHAESDRAKSLVLLYHSPPSESCWFHLSSDLVQAHFSPKWSGSFKQVLWRSSGKLLARNILSSPTHIKIQLETILILQLPCDFISVWCFQSFGEVGPCRKCSGSPAFHLRSPPHGFCDDLDAKVSCGHCDKVCYSLTMSETKNAKPVHLAGGKDQERCLGFPNLYSCVIILFLVQGSSSQWNPIKESFTD